MKNYTTTQGQEFKLSNEICECLQVRYLIVDGSNERNHTYLGHDMEFGGSTDGALQFETEQKAQDYINELDWQDWAYVEEN